jgi:hypothetical protein
MPNVYHVVYASGSLHLKQGVVIMLAWQTQRLGDCTLSAVADPLYCSKLDRILDTYSFRRIF